MKFRRLWAVLAAVVVLLLLAGCSTVRERSFKVSPDWSRGNRIGITSIRQPVALAADDEGAYVVWPVRTDQATRLQYLRLGSDGLAASETTLALDTIFPQSPQLITGDDLHLFLVTREDTAQSDGVYHIALDRAGQLLSEPQRLSGDDQKVGDMVARRATDGSMNVLWDVVEGPGLGVYYVRLDANGAMEGFPQLIGPEGHRPAAQVGQDGALHMAWMLPAGATRQEIYYAAAPAGGAAGDPVMVANALIASTDVESAPTIALNGPEVAILWSVEHRSGLNAGVAELFYVTFAGDAPAEQAPLVVHIPDDPNPDYQEIERFAPVSHVAVPPAGAFWSGFVEAPSALPWSGEAGALLANMTYNFRVNPRSQLVLLLMEGDGMAAYQQPALTRQFSLHPTGAVAPDGSLHTAWIDLENPGAYAVYYASTRPAALAALDRRTVNDTFNDSVDLVWGMASGLTMLPLSIIAALPILVVAGMYYLTGHDGALRGNRGAQFALVVAIALYFATKILVMGGLLARPPLMQQIPENLVIGWTWLLTLLIAAVAAVVTIVYCRRNRRPELLKAAMLFFCVDTVLTLLLYGPTFYGD